jgi:hypothetical protein
METKFATQTSSDSSPLQKKRRRMKGHKAKTGQRLLAILLLLSGSLLIFFMWKHANKKVSASNERTEFPACAWCGSVRCQNPTTMAEHVSAQIAVRNITFLALLQRRLTRGAIPKCALKCSPWSQIEYHLMSLLQGPIAKN